MSAPYSYDLRRKAIAALKRGKPKTDVSQMFNISRNTLDLWLNREAETGECRAITHFQKGCRHKITDWVFSDNNIVVCLSILLWTPQEQAVMYSSKGTQRSVYLSRNSE